MVMELETRQRLIAQYKSGYGQVVEALADMSEGELDVREGPGEWSPRQVVHHLADSEMTSALRLRKLIAEQQPMIYGYDQDEYARTLFYDRPIDASLAAFRAARETTAEILDCMSEQDWSRAGTHSESGAYSVETWLAIYADHAYIHADQIRRARAANL
jgi:hypothetical protein